MAKDLTKIVDEEKKRARLYILLRFIIGGVIILTFFFVYCGVNGGFSTDIAWKSRCRVLSDGFFLAGGIFVGAGLLVVVANAGEFYFLSYTVKYLLAKFIHSIPEGTMSYGDYVTSRKGKRTPFWFLIILGGVFILGAVVFVLLFNAAAAPATASSLCYL